jgi:hypothetical protein
MVVGRHQCHQRRFGESQGDPPPSLLLPSPSPLPPPSSLLPPSSLINSPQIWIDENLPRLKSQTPDNLTAEKGNYFANLKLFGGAEELCVGLSEPNTPQSKMSAEKIRHSLISAETACEILYARKICLLLLNSEYVFFSVSCSF